MEIVLVLKFKVVLICEVQSRLVVPVFEVNEVHTSCIIIFMK